ncbi:hypothetical protein IAU59_005039 [Kwoniella sp. CBS 9459]
MTIVNAVASSSKRPAPTTTPSAEPTSAKRPRPSKASESVDGDADDDDNGEDFDGDRSGSTLGENGEILDMDEEARAKVARKEARTIRNRESAQRSRNQRKAHLAYLEARVVELENENRTLRGDGPASAWSPSMSGSGFGSPSASAREASPAQSVISLANDLGIPTELVSGTGVKLSSVAPPPANMHLEDVKPVIPQSPSHEDVELKTVVPTTPIARASASISPADRLHAENAALRERVSLLENLVKQVVAVANLSGINDRAASVVSGTSTVAEQEHQPELVSPIAANNIDWAAFLSVPHITPTTAPSAPGLDATLSPPYYPATLADAPKAPTDTQSNLPTNQMTPVSSSIVEVTSNPVAPGEGDYLDVIFGGSNGGSDSVATIGSVSNQTSVGGEIGGSVGQATRMDQDNVNNGNGNVNIPQAFEGLFSQAQQQMDWEIEISNSAGAGQVQAQGESWDEAMRSLIEDIEGGNRRQEETGDRSEVLGMDWFGNSEVRV